MSAIQKRQSQKIEDQEKELAELEKQLSGDLEKEVGKVEDKPEEETEAKEAKSSDPEEEKGKTPDEELDEGNWKKRFGDLRRHSQSKEKGFQSQLEEKEARIKELEAANNKVELPASDEDLDSWKEKYPDVAAIVETVAIKIADQRFSEAKISIDEINQSRKEADKATAKATIVKAHPDFDAIAGSDEFHDWTDEQPKWVQDALFENSDDARSVIRAIDLYKLDTGQKGIPNTDLAKEAAKEVKTKSKVEVEEKGGKTKFRESQVEKMTDKEFAENEAAIDEAIRSGQFMYDLSGAAR